MGAVGECLDKGFGALARGSGLPGSPERLDAERLALLAEAPWCTTPDLGLRSQRIPRFRSPR